MHEELIGELHIVASGVQSKRRRELLEKAADAIEELSLTAASYKRSMEAWADEAENVQPKWIPVTERLPKIGETVIVAIKSKMHKGAYIVQTSFLCYDNTFTLDDVDMWMPLPEPPKEET